VGGSCATQSSAELLNAALILPLVSGDNHMEDVISACEKRDTWQATGRHSKGYLVALLHAARSAWHKKRVGLKQNARPKLTLTAEGRRRIAAAQRVRWAKAKAQQKRQLRRTLRDSTNHEGHATGCAVPAEQVRRGTPVLAAFVTP